jgi:hypothetical protein
MSLWWQDADCLCWIETAEASKTAAVELCLWDMLRLTRVLEYRSEWNERRIVACRDNLQETNSRFDEGIKILFPEQNFVLVEWNRGRFAESKI